MSGIETNNVVERLIGLHRRDGPPSIYGEAADLIQSLSDRIDELEGEKALSELCAQVEADAVSGLRYIERHYGRLEGVGWDRVFNAHDELFAQASLTQGGKNG